MTTTTTAKKTTKREYFNILLGYAEVQENPEVVKFIKNELDLLDKKKASIKPTATQQANNAILEAILEYMDAEPTKLYTITEFIKNVDECKDLQNQKISAIVRLALRTEDNPDGPIERVEEKRRAYFRLA